MVRPLFPAAIPGSGVSGSSDYHNQAAVSGVYRFYQFFHSLPFDGCDSLERDWKKRGLSVHGLKYLRGCSDQPASQADHQRLTSYSLMPGRLGNL